MELLGVLMLSVYISSVFVSLLLVIIVRSWLSSNRYFTVKGRRVRVKYPFIVILLLLLMSFIPIVNTILAHRLMCKILT